MQGHIVWFPVSVYVSDVMNSADRQHNLANRIDNGQVDYGPARRKGQEVTGAVLYYMMVVSYSIQ